MRCTRCGADADRVADSRDGTAAALQESLRPAMEGVPFRHRRRDCGRCGHRWTTVEVSAMDLLRVVRTAREAGPPAAAEVSTAEAVPARLREILQEAAALLGEGG